MLIKKGQLPILITLICFLFAFTIFFSFKKNYEFLIYIGVIVFFMILIIATNKKVDYPNNVLWGLTVWAMLHMAGGGVYIRGTRLYEIILIPLSNTYPILRYDQFVHIVGFGVATLVMYVLLKPLLKPNLKKWTALSIIIVMAGFGLGALNEMIEFIATILVPETGVGGFINTSLDLVADLVGAVFALIYIRFREAKKNGKNGYT
jgi:putative membrane protein